MGRTAPCFLFLYRVVPVSHAGRGIFFFSFFCFFFIHAQAATRTSTAAGGNWNAGGSWVGGVAPATTDAVIIATTGTGKITVNVASTCVGVTINSGATLVSTTLTLTVNGPWVNNGTYTQGTATVSFGSASAAINNGAGTANFNNISVASGATLAINTNVTAGGTFVFAAVAVTSTININSTNSVTVTGLMTMPRPSTGATCNLNIGNGSLQVGGNFTMSATTGTRRDIITIGNGTFTVIGNFTNSTTGCQITFSGSGIMNLGGTVSTSVLTLTPGTGTVNYNRSNTQTVWNTTYYNLTLSGTSAKTTTTVTVNGTLSMEGTATASAAPTYGGSATLQYNTATGRTAGVEWITPFAASGGVIIANTGAINPGAAKVFNTNVPLTINSGATLTTGANTFTFNGNLVNNGTWTASTGNIVITGTATQSIGLFNTTGTVSMTKTAGTATFTGGENGGAFTLNGSGGTLNLGVGLTHTFTGTWTNTAGTLAGNTSTLNIAGTSTGTGVSFTANTGTVNFTGSSAQSIPAFTYYDVNFSGAGLKTLSGTTGSGHVLTIGVSSELDLSSMTLNLSGSGTPLVNNGTFTASTSTVNYTNAGSTVITGVNYNNLNGTGGNRTFSTSATIGIAGTFTAGGGVYTVTNSTVDFNGGSAQTIPAFTYYNLIVSNAGIKSVLGGTTVACQTITINDSAIIEINADGGAVLNVLQ